MKKALSVILHILGYPVVVGLIAYLNWNTIVTQFKNYNIYVFVGLAVTLLMAIIYYVVYACIVCSNNKKKKSHKKVKSIFNQTLRICLAIVIPMVGLWAAADIALPDILADLTSSTIYYEDLADAWPDRAEINESLLNDFISMSVKAGTLPYNEETMSEDEAIEYYQGMGIDEVVPELEGNEYYDTINGLFAIQYQSMNANGYQTFTNPWIGFATGGRLTIPCLVHLLLDEREINVDKITLDEYTEVTTDGDGTTEVTSVLFAVYDEETKSITLKHVNWTVLDMLGEDNVVDLSSTLAGLIERNETVRGIVKNKISGKGVVALLKNVLNMVSVSVADEDILNSDITVYAEVDTEKDVYKVVLKPANEDRGVLGYQNMAWLDSNGLIYALVTLFSCRRVFLACAGYLVLINLLIGCCRGMCKEEKEKRFKVARVPKKKEQNAQPIYGNIQ